MQSTKGQPRRTTLQDPNLTHARNPADGKSCALEKMAWRRTVTKNPTQSPQRPRVGQHERNVRRHKQADQRVSFRRFLAVFRRPAGRHHRRGQQHPYARVPARSWPGRRVYEPAGGTYRSSFSAHLFESLLSHRLRRNRNKKSKRFSSKHSHPFLLHPPKGEGAKQGWTNHAVRVVRHEERHSVERDASVIVRAGGNCYHAMFFFFLFVGEVAARETKHWRW